MGQLRRRKERDDVVLIKVNCQWSERGGTNTDVVKGLIQAIIDHPDGFSGEIVIVDNGQGRGSFTWAAANAIDHSQSIQSVADSFSGRVNISTFLWDTIRNSEVTEYHQGNSNNGYVVNHTANPRTGMYVSYPKFRTVYGTNISLKNGIWKDGVYDNTRLKLINVPVLKTHSGAGVTGCVKHYVGVLSVAKTDGLAPVDHGWIFTGGLGTQMVESRLPDLNIVELLSKWVGESEKGVREIFRKARQAAPCIIFFDEIDALVPRRSGGDSSHVSENVVSQILTEIDGLEELNDVLIIGATNRLDIVDEELLRPGRFDRVIEVPKPDAKGREHILKIHTKKKPLDSTVKQFIKTSRDNRWV